MKKCFKCKRSENVCKKYSLGDINICEKCNYCRKCIKDNKNCEQCCTSCKRCKKNMLKDNWPEDVIIDKYCEKCHHLCKDCGKYLSYDKFYYKKKNSRYCIDCFENVYLSKDLSEEEKNRFIYKIISKKEDYGNMFISWKKTHEILNCQKCNKEFKKYIFFNKTICKSCTNSSKQKTEMNLNPSTYDKIYTKNNLEKWILDSQRIKCINCYSSIWIKIDNTKKGKIYRCRNCPPKSSNNKKYKYDNIFQKWICYRQIIKCNICRSNKWIFTKDIIEKNVCNKCFKKTNNEKN